jgi:two-component system nitrate/nitrite response regulator NarL
MSIEVVIVDDDAGFRRLATTLLALRGCTIVGTAADGASGIKAAKHLKPHGMLVDVNLPDQDGLSVAREIHDLRLPISVVLTSTECVPWSEGELADAGVDAFVVKESLPDVDLATLFSG